MTELLTESFCERCGTRYTFEANQRRRGSTSRLRVLSLGLRTFIANDDTSLSEAMAAARNDEARAIAARQMDAFHRTFNFCFSCRQYICANCWNDLAGTCLTCHPLEIDQYDRSAQLAAVAPMAETASVAPNMDAPDVVAPGVAARPSEAPAVSSPPLLRPRLEAVARLRTDTATEADAEAPTEAAGAVEAPTEPEPTVATTGAAAAESASPAEAPPAEAPSADELTADELQTIRQALGAAPTAETIAARSAERAIARADEPGADAEPEPAVEPAAVEPTAAVEPAAVEPAAVEPTAAVEPAVTPLASEPSVLAAEPAPAQGGGQAATPGRPVRFGRLRTSGLLARYRPAASDKLLPVRGASDAAGERAELLPSVVAGEAAAQLPAEPVPAAAAEPAPPPAEPAPDRRSPRAEPPPAAPPAGARDVVSQPVWSVVAPDTDEMPAPHRTPGPRPAARSLDLPPSAWAARLATARPDDVWTLSAQDVITNQAGAPAPSVQPCVQCGLALSANARFCRRCGAGQG